MNAAYLRRALSRREPGAYEPTARHGECNREQSDFPAPEIGVSSTPKIRGSMTLGWFPKNPVPGINSSVKLDEWIIVDGPVRLISGTLPRS